MTSFVALVAPNPTYLKARLTVMSDNNLQVSNWECYAIQNWPSVRRVTQCRFSQSARSFGHPPLCLSISPSTCFLGCATEDWLMPTKATTLRVETPFLSCTKVLCFVLETTEAYNYKRFYKLHLTYYGTKTTQCTRSLTTFQLRNAHRDVDVGRVAANKSEYYNPTHFNISYIRNPIFF
jgi:hypothetical protein